jgi:hypothetical protein
MHPIQDLFFLKIFSYVLQIDMHFICTPMWTNFYSCEKWVLHLSRVGIQIWYLKMSHYSLSNPYGHIKQIVIKEKGKENPYLNMGWIPIAAQLSSFSPCGHSSCSWPTIALVLSCRPAKPTCTPTSLGLFMHLNPHPSLLCVRATTVTTLAVVDHPRSAHHGLSPPYEEQAPPPSVPPRKP